MIRKAVDEMTEDELWNVGPFPPIAPRSAYDPPTPTPSPSPTDG